MKGKVGRALLLVLVTLMMGMAPLVPVVAAGGSFGGKAILAGIMDGGGSSG
jgi:hypothetical protein